MAVKQNYKNVLKYLEENNIDPKKALEIIVKADPYNPNNIQARWKMKRFQLYLWARLDELENGWLLKKTETVRNVVHSKKFRETAEVFDPQFYWKVGNFWLKQSLKSTLSKIVLSGQNVIWVPVFLLSSIFSRELAVIPC